MIDEEYKKVTENCERLKREAWELLREKRGGTPDPTSQDIFTSLGVMGIFAAIVLFAVL